MMKYKNGFHHYQQRIFLFSKYAINLLTYYIVKLLKAEYLYRKLLFEQHKFLHYNCPQKKFKKIDKNNFCFFLFHCKRSAAISYKSSFSMYGTCYTTSADDSCIPHHLFLLLSFVRIEKNIEIQCVNFYLCKGKMMNFTDKCICK